MQALLVLLLRFLFTEKYNKTRMQRIRRGRKEGNMSLKMKELPLSERPYEKAQMYGIGKLSDSELLAVIIKCGTREDTSIGLAHKILNLNTMEEQGDLSFLQNVSIEELTQIKGIGTVKAIQILAACELAKRMSKPIHSTKIVIKETKDVSNLLMNELRYEKREIVKLLILNAKNILVKNINITHGGASFASIEPHVILAEPVKMNAPKIVLVHNHPSGDSKPSSADFRVTQRIRESADVMGIELKDHIIIANRGCTSILGIMRAQLRKKLEKERRKEEKRKEKEQKDKE